MKEKFLFTVSTENGIRLLPPLITKEEQVQEILIILPELINEFMDMLKA